MSLAPPESLVQLLLPLAGVSNAVIYNAVAASAFFTWEYFITLDAEVELMWRPRRNWISTLFIAIRYLTLANMIVVMVMATDVLDLVRPSQKGCFTWMWFELISAPLLLLCVEMLLIARVFAFYERNKPLLAMLITMSVCANVARFCIIGKLAPGVAIVQNPLPLNLHFGACLVVTLPPLFSSSWIPEFIPETVLFILVIVKLIRAKLHSKVGSSRVLFVLVRDGSWAFALIFAGSIWAILEFELAQSEGLIPLCWMTSFLGFCGSRLILNLRSAGQAPGGYVDALELNMLNVTSGTLQEQTGKSTYSVQEV